MEAYSPRERVIILLLRLGGVVTVAAFGAMIMPTSWMVAGHSWLGLGTFPTLPITDYLTRSISALYGFHGVLLLLISTDIRRYRPLVIYVGAMNVAFGCFVLAIDLHAGMPAFWTWSEGPSLIAMGAVILALVKSVRS